MAQLQQKVGQPQIMGFASSSLSALATAVAAEVNTLNGQLSTPALNSQTGAANPVGNVVPGSITVSDISQAYIGQAAQYMATVHWEALIAPI